METEKGFGKGARRRAHKSHMIRNGEIEHSSIEEAAEFIEKNGLDDYFFFRLGLYKKLGEIMEKLEYEPFCLETLKQDYPKIYERFINMYPIKLIF